MSRTPTEDFKIYDGQILCKVSQSRLSKERINARFGVVWQDIMEVNCANKIGKRYPVKRYLKVYLGNLLSKVIPCQSSILYTEIHNLMPDSMPLYCWQASCKEQIQQTTKLLLMTPSR